MSDQIFSVVPAGLMIERVVSAPERVVVMARPVSRSADCPLCNHQSTRRHSAYERRLADLPWQGRIVELRVRVRRFRCANDGCRRRVFAERLPAVAGAKARRSIRLNDAQRQIGLALGGEPGARLTKHLAMPVGGDTLLRMVRAIDLGPPDAPHVLGVDDFAFRRGQRYGTLIHDLERRRAIDLLPDRQADTLATWLKQHPSVVVVARDRAGAYGDGIRQGAPAATQVADRWHLLRNCSDALQQVFDRRHQQVRQAVRAAAGTEPTAPPDDVELQPLPRAERLSRDRLMLREARYEDIARRREQGMPLKQIARELGLGHKTVKRWLRAGRAPTWRKPLRTKLIDPYRNYLERRWQEGCHNATRLWTELHDQGFPGQPGVVRLWATHRRRQSGPGSPAPNRPAVRIPTSRQAVRLVMADAAKLDDKERQLTEVLVSAAPEIEQAVRLARAFITMIKQRDAPALAAWIAAARASDLAGFAEGVQRDHAAIEAALTLPWSTGPVEGRINKLKLVKRQMYGRAKFDLLRQRVLAAA